MLSSFIIRRLIPVKPPPVFRRDSLSGADGMQMNQGGGGRDDYHKGFLYQRNLYTLKINRIYIFSFFLFSFAI